MDKAGSLRQVMRSSCRVLARVGRGKARAVFMLAALLLLYHGTVGPCKYAAKGGLIDESLLALYAVTVRWSSILGKRTPTQKPRGPTSTSTTIEELLANAVAERAVPALVCGDLESKTVFFPLGSD